MTKVQRIGTATATRMIVPVFVLSLMAASAQAATWYVDSSVASSGNGQSWSTAWKNLSNVSGVSAGDIVYISGGPSGQSQTYSISSWAAPNGSSASRITYQIGQDSLHNGTAIFSGSGGFFSDSSPPNNVNFLGYVTNDTAMHFQLSGYGGINGTATSNGASVSNYRFAYVNMPTFTVAGYQFAVFTFSSTTSMEIDHIFCYCTPNPAPYVFCLWNSLNGSTYDSIQFHDSVIYVPSDTAGSQTYNVGGSDGFNGAGSGLTISNNIVISYITSAFTSSSPNHQDGWQSWNAMSYLKICNNVFAQMGDAGIYIDAYSGSPTYNHVRIYNNIILATEGHGLLIDVELNSGTYSDTVIANNFVDDNNYNGIGPSQEYLWAAYGGSITFNNCVFANNVSVDQGFGLGAIQTIEDNVQLASSQGSGYFKRYTMGSTNNDVHLTSAATSLIGQGANLTSYGITTDRDGNPRPATGAWDVGPYQYAVASTNPAISVTPSSLNFGSVASGVTVTNTFTVQNTGGGTLAGTATVAAPFHIVSGGTYNLGNSQTQTVGVSYSPSGSNSSQVVTFTGGGGATATVSGSLLEVLSGLSFESYAGVVSAPFSTNGGYVSQSVLATNVASGGSASYYFNITNAGQYIVQASVLAPNSGAKSFWVNMDALPVDPTMIWDIYPYSTNWQTVAVSWRGNSTTLTNDQYNPEIFNLTSGIHDLIIIGREANVGLGQITITPYSASRPSPPPPPVNLRIVANP